MLEVRVARAADARALARVCALAFNALNAGLGLAPEWAAPPVALLEGKIRGATSVAFVATAAARSGSCGGDGGAPLSGGGGGVGAEEEETADAVVVGGAAAVHCERVIGVGPVFVDPTRAGRGAGRALMREVGPCARVSARRGNGAARRAHS